MQKAVYAMKQEGAGEGRINVEDGTRSRLEGFVPVPATWPGPNLQIQTKALAVRGQLACAYMWALPSHTASVNRSIQIITPTAKNPEHKTKVKGHIGSDWQCLGGGGE